MDFFGFSKDWSSLIYECVCSSKVSILINRELTGYFEIRGGLRQGDPLSPYLFILAEEILSLNIAKLVSQNQVTPIYRAPASPSVCHLMFATLCLLMTSSSFSKPYLGVSKPLRVCWKLTKGQPGSISTSGKCNVLFGNNRESFKAKTLSSLGISQASFPQNTWAFPFSMAAPKLSTLRVSRTLLGKG